MSDGDSTALATDDAAAAGSGLPLLAAATACLVMMSTLAIYGVAWLDGRDPPHHPWAGLGQIVLAMGLLAARRSTLAARGGASAWITIGTYVLLALASTALFAWSAFA